MYETRFGLQRRPFPPTPDTAAYYPATGHEAALAILARGLAEDEGLALLTGPPGTGKTLLGYVLLERLPGAPATAFLTNGRLPDRVGLLQALLYDLGLPYDGPEQVLRLRLTDHLLKNCAAGRGTLLVIDEAHYLSADLLEELRLLGNLEAGPGRAVQVLLIAQPALGPALDHPALGVLNQRLAVRARIDPLGVEEACDYLLHHLRRAGGRPETIIEDAALEVLARGSGGVPRVLSRAAHQAFLLADAGELPCVDAEAALEALAALGLSAAPEPPVLGPVGAA